MFLRIVERMLVLQPVLPQPRTERETPEPGGPAASGGYPE
jgi:hypothetical protein